MARIDLHLAEDLFIDAESHGVAPMSHKAVVAAVEARDMGGDQLTLADRQLGLLAQKRVMHRQKRLDAFGKPLPEGNQVVLLGQGGVETHLARSLIR